MEPLDDPEWTFESSSIAKHNGIIESPNDKSGPLTFGLEIEFLYPTLFSGIRDPYPHDGRTLCVVVRSDVEAEEQLRFFLEDVSGIPFYLRYDDEYDAGLLLYNHWRLLDDVSVKFFKHENMRDTDMPVRPRAGYVWDVCRALRKTRIHLNDTASVHVHIGRGDEPFSLVTMKKTTCLLYLIDEMLLKLHHPSRQNNEHCRPLAKRSNLADLIAHNAHRDFMVYTSVRQQGMGEFIPVNATSDRLVQECRDMVAIAKLMCEEPDYSLYPGRGTVGFTRFLPVSGVVQGNIQTFEFRQMGASLDPDHIIYWARVCLAIVNFARLSDGLYEEEIYFRAKIAGYSMGDVEFYEGERAGNLFVPEMPE
ncbi:uncharacterized protein F4822DRAFT_444305 [Hypoxylon trugodes]|uniref:uncharacterized protein n=1 Tax=Hypoxylon trugodes TaxID=326681 RepID=UPI002195B4A0|nr:uncharacterized protein F4822DRAFT_444305 [Hypoxylon trugodes]KAI1387708.1 hypothetical protein F4822DRAFT_444305 [Hypoxylon trugodes]